MMLTQRISVLAHDLAKQCHVAPIRVDSKVSAGGTVGREKRKATSRQYRHNSGEDPVLAMSYSWGQCLLGFLISSTLPFVWQTSKLVCLKPEDKATN